MKASQNPKMDRGSIFYKQIYVALGVIGADLKRALKDVELTESYKSKHDALRLIVSRKGVQIKVELSPVLRGTVHEPQWI